MSRSPIWAARFAGSRTIFMLAPLWRTAEVIFEENIKSRTRTRIMGGSHNNSFSVRRFAEMVCSTSCAPTVSRGRAPAVQLRGSHAHGPGNDHRTAAGLGGGHLLDVPLHRGAARGLLQAWRDLPGIRRIDRRGDA